MFILRSLGIFAAAAIAVVAVFFPKIYYICKRVNTLDGTPSSSKTSRISITDADAEGEEIQAEEDRVAKDLKENAGDDEEKQKLKSLLRHVHSKMQDGTLPMKWNELEALDRSRSR